MRRSVSLRPLLLMSFWRAGVSPRPDCMSLRLCLFLVQRSSPSGLPPLVSSRRAGLCLRGLPRSSSSGSLPLVPSRCSGLCFQSLRRCSSPRSSPPSLVSSWRAGLRRPSTFLRAKVFISDPSLGRGLRLFFGRRSSSPILLWVEAFVFSSGGGLRL